MVSTVAIAGIKVDPSIGITFIYAESVNQDSPVATTTQTFAHNTYAAITQPTLTGNQVIRGVFITGTASGCSLRLKGDSGDTGFLLHRTETTYLSLDTGATPGILAFQDSGSADTFVKFVWV